MPDPTNEQRARWAKIALTAFAEEVDGQDTDELLKAHIRAMGGDPEISSDFEDQISDLITDLLHLARITGIDTQKLLANAVGNFTRQADA